MSGSPRFSIFTPSHTARFLDDCLESLLAQSDGDWEWIVVLNGGIRWRPNIEDSRISILIDDQLTGVGAAKRVACAAARGDILVELDHDDLLTTNALHEIGEAFGAHPGVVFVYSHCAQVLENGERDDSQFDADSGWTYREAVIEDRHLKYAVAMAPTPHNVSYIWFAPNHVRAFRRDAYEQVGGYDASRAVLDDQDLMARLYEFGEFLLIDECLYLQRMHGRNTQRDEATNLHIQTETVRLYDLYFERNALAWARRKDLLCLDMGAAHNRPDGYLGVDQYPGDRVDIVATLPEPLDLADGSVGVIRAYDFLEHVYDKVAVMNEFYRLLAPGGILLSMTPSTDGRGAFQDPTHVAFYNENSFWYFTEAKYRDFVPQITARFQSSRLATVFPSDWHSSHNIPYVYGNLIALKDDFPRQGGALYFESELESNTISVDNSTSLLGTSILRG
jgi:glycosyltransferase involved in cell wall biosynthesis